MRTDSILQGRLPSALDLGVLQQRVKVGSPWQTYSYRSANQVPLVTGQDALKVNGCELSVSDPKGEILYRNAWITDWPITEQNVADLAASGRARWKIENENNNTLKTKGYHLEHNFYFPSWATLLRLMMRGLEIGPYQSDLTPNRPVAWGVPGCHAPIRFRPPKPTR